MKTRITYVFIWYYKKIIPILKSSNTDEINILLNWNCVIDMIVSSQLSRVIQSCFDKNFHPLNYKKIRNTMRRWHLQTKHFSYLMFLFTNYLDYYFLT